MQSRAFTLLELMVTVVIIAVLGVISSTVFSSFIASSHDASCISSLRQMGIATNCYLADHNGSFFPYVVYNSDGSTSWYFGKESASVNAEGERDLDKTQGALFPYIEPDTVEICPAFDYGDVLYKPKFKGASWAYGYNWHLGGTFFGKPVKKNYQLKNASRVIVFADCAQINTFQPPASSSNPMVEEFYLVDPNYKTFHFRHREKANALFLDGHVEKVLPKNFDKKIDEANIGNIDWQEYPASLQ